MTASTSLHSNALNFMGFVQNGVDPRTGQYTVAISLPEIGANALRGPQVPLSLAYSPLNTTDSGFGLGWTLRQSQFDPRKQVVSLDSGESFKVTRIDAGNGRMYMSEQKIDSFHLYDLGNGQYRLVHKNGSEERLAIRGSGDHSMAVPVDIHAASGHGIHLDYSTFDRYPVLTTVQDDAGVRLLTLERQSAQVQIVVRPDASVQSAAQARFVMQLRDSDHKVESITLPTEESAAWRFSYAPVHGQMRMSEVHTPSGAHEQIFYQDQGHAFPNLSDQPRLPRVTRHVLHPGAGQDSIEVRYSYQTDDLREHNFLGAGLELDWRDDGLDNLYRHLGDYQYRTSEALFVDGHEQRRIERTFNRCHLLTLEVTTQGNNQQRKETSYPLLPDLPFVDQPNDCQLPSQLTTRWTLLDDPRRMRSETVSSRYDHHGNLLRQEQANGIVELRSWYPASGAGADCPADPEGFVRCLKDKTVIPAAVTGQAGEAAPELHTGYRYLRLPALTASGMPDWLAPLDETLVNSGTGEVLQRTTYDYLDLPGDPLRHGRTGRETRTVGGFDSLTEYSWRLLADAGLPRLETTRTLSSRFDPARQTSSSQQALYGGQIVQTLSEGVETRYRYDALDRLIEESVAPDTPFAASRRYQYRLSAAAGEQAEQSVIDARGVSTRTLLDGLGRTVSEERDQVDEHNPGQRLAIYQARYDAFGHLREETRRDWLDGRILALTTRLDYDDWGRQRCMTGPDGVQHHQTTDPIGSLDDRQAVVRSWLQGSGPDAPSSARTEVWLNLFGKPDRELRLDADGQPLSQVSYRYDGLGRCLASTDELSLSTAYRYDAWSRLVRTELPDGTAIERDYAAHSRAELATGLRVIDTDLSAVQVGEQAFDSLERLTRLTVSQRSETFHYTPEHSRLSQRITAAGAVIDYRYNLALTGEPVAIAVQTGQDKSSQATQASFAYDPVSARIVSASNEQGQREYRYDVHNHLRTERWIDPHNQAWETRHVSSLAGLALSTTLPGPTGQPGPQTRYHYNDSGQLSSLEQGHVLASFSHDGLGRPQRITTRDLAANSVLTVTLAYDLQGREVCRTLTQAPHSTQIIEQSWRKDGLLKRRHWQQAGQTLLDEHFEYDPRGRLSVHDCQGTQLPGDALGRDLTRQVFRYDALDNLKTVLSTFADASTERATFDYDPASPCQLAGIRYSPARTQANPLFSYDADGNQLNDQNGRALRYDSLGRLLSVAGNEGQYRYDGHDQLVSLQQAGAGAALCFYDGQQLSSLIQDGRQTCVLHGPDGFEQPLAQQQTGDPTQTLLLHCDANHSVRGESQQDEQRRTAYSAYGDAHAEPSWRSLPGFNGQWRDQASGWYLLGNGYRAYNPQLMRFHSPDNLSPFGAGGVNPYAYCLGNPIALRDPTGHQGIGWGGQLRPNWDQERFARAGGSGLMSWVFVGIGVIGTALAVAAAIASFGLLTPVAVAAAEGTAAATAGATAGAVTSGAITATATGGAAAGATATAAAAGAAGGAAAGAATGVSTVGAVVFGSMVGSAALSAGSTVASAVEAATGNATAGQWGQFLAIGAFLLGLVGGAGYTLIPKAGKAATKLGGGISGAIGAGRVEKTAGAAASVMDDVAATTTKATGLLNPMSRTSAASAGTPVVGQVAPLPRAHVPVRGGTGGATQPSWLGSNWILRHRYIAANYLRSQGHLTATPNNVGAIRV